MLLLDGAWQPGRIVWEDQAITEIEVLPGLDPAARDLFVAPGMIDLHVHGFGGADPLENLGSMARAMARVGTTAFQPTLFPRTPAELGLQARALDGERLRLRPGDGARVLGTHLEGPFVNPRSAGALPVEDLALPGRDALRELLGPAMGDGLGIGTITLAPELPGASDLIAECVALGLRVSIGHSLASGEQAMAAFAAGAQGVTHLFNAMPAFHHRKTGPAGAAPLRGGVFAEIIGDLVHVGERAVQLALAARGPASLCLVSDALQGAGTGCDVFHSHGRRHIIQDGAAYYPAGPERDVPQLAGSASSQLDMVRRLTSRGVVGSADALTMATLAPARALGMQDRIGQLKVGLQSDLIVLRGHRLNLVETVVAGRSQ